MDQRLHAREIYDKTKHLPFLERVNLLPKKERLVFEQLMKGHAAKKIAIVLNKSQRTAETQIQSIGIKLNMSDRDIDYSRDSVKYLIRNYYEALSAVPGFSVDGLLY